MMIIERIYSDHEGLLFFHNFSAILWNIFI